MFPPFFLLMILFLIYCLKSLGSWLYLFLPIPWTRAFLDGQPQPLAALSLVAVYKILRINNAAETIASTSHKLKNRAPAAPPRADNTGSHQGQKAAINASRDPKKPIPLFLPDCLAPSTPTPTTNSVIDIITNIASIIPVSMSTGVVFHTILPNKIWSRPPLPPRIINVAR